MTRRFGPILLVVGILCSTCAWAQTDTGGTPTLARPLSLARSRLTPIRMRRRRWTSSPGSMENSSITLGIGAGFSYDSNGYPTTSRSSGSLAVSRCAQHQDPAVPPEAFVERVVCRRATRRTPIQPDRRMRTTNLFSQSGERGIYVAVGPALAARWRMTVSSYSANPFDSLPDDARDSDDEQSQSGDVLPADAIHARTMRSLTLTDQLTKVDTLTFTGTASLRRTSTYNLVTSVPFYNLISYGGRASYSHQLSPRLSLGAGYNYNSLDFGKGQQRSGIQTISMTADYLIRPNMSISGWVGPEYTSTKTTFSFQSWVD